MFSSSNCKFSGGSPIPHPKRSLTPTAHEWEQFTAEYDKLPPKQWKKMDRLIGSETKKINFPVKHEIDVDVTKSGESTPYAISWLEGLDPKDPDKSRFHHPLKSSFAQYVKEKDFLKSLLTLAGLNPNSPGRTNPGTPGTKHYDGTKKAKYVDSEGNSQSTSLDITELHKKLKAVAKQREAAEGWFQDDKKRWHRPFSAIKPSSFFKDFNLNRARALNTIQGENPVSPGLTLPGTPNTPHFRTTAGYTDTIVQGKVIGTTR